MRQTRTKFLSVLLTLALVLGLLPALGTTALAASGSGTEGDPYVVTDYDELRELLRSKTESDPTCYIKLGGDITDSSSRNNHKLSIHDGADIVLDLAGHSLTRSGSTTDSYLFAVCGASLTVNDSVGGGGITARTVAGGPYLTGAAIWVQNWSKSRLTVNGGTFAGGEYGIVTEGGTTVINGGTILSLNPEISSFVQSIAGYFRIGTVIVNGGTFGDSTSAGDAIDIRDAADVTLNNCTAYCAMYSEDRSWPSIKTGTTVTLNGTVSTPKGNYYSDRHVGDKFVISTTAPKPVITKQPAAASGEVGSPMTFSVTATGADSYNWYIYDAGDAQAYSWSSIKQHATVSGESTSKITITPTDTWLNGKVLDCTIKGSGGFAYTDQAKITVTAAPKTISAVAVTGIDAPVFGKTPDNTTVVPADAQYTVAAVSWEPACESFLGNSVYSVLVSLESKDGLKFAAVPAVTINGETAKVVSGAGSEELKISYTFPKTPAAYDFITNTYSTTDVTASLNEYVAVSVYTDLPDMAKNIKYQWYKAASNYYGTGTAISGATAAGYAIPTNAEGTAYYYCVVAASVDGKTVTSESSDALLVKVTVKAGLPVITAQPKSVTVKPGADVTFSVAATGEALNYQWWRETKSGASKVGTNGPTYTIKAVNIPDDNGTAYYCVVSNKAGEVTSDKARLTVSELGTMTAFSDVPEGAYYTDAVAWAVEKGVTSGTSSTTFSPNADCTRAQIVTFLWRAAGSPAPKSKESSFADVAADAYYSDAVRWAVENGITSGTSATTFSPNATCTRAQTVTFLWRSQKSPADGAANAFTDVAEGTYYTDAVKWAVKNGITSGTSATTFSPNADCSRAQIVTFLHRCMAK